MQAKPIKVRVRRPAEEVARRNRTVLLPAAEAPRSGVELRPYHKEDDATLRSEAMRFKKEREAIGLKFTLILRIKIYYKQLKRIKNPLKCTKMHENAHVYMPLPSAWQAFQQEMEQMLQRARERKAREDALAEEVGAHELKRLEAQRRQQRLEQQKEELGCPENHFKSLKRIVII